MSKRTPNVDYDNNWKEVVEKQLANVVSFFLPNFHPHVDWTRKPEFLEQEMRIIRRNTQKGRKKIVDKLVKVWLKTGEEYWILIHIEIVDRALWTDQNLPSSSSSKPVYPKTGKIDS